MWKSCLACKHLSVCLSLEKQRSYRLITFKVKHEQPKNEVNNAYNNYGFVNMNKIKSNVI